MFQSDLHHGSRGDGELLREPRHDGRGAESDSPLVRVQRESYQIFEETEARLRPRIRFVHVVQQPVHRPVQFNLRAWSTTVERNRDEPGIVQGGGERGVESWPPGGYRATVHGRFNVAVDLAVA